MNKEIGVGEGLAAWLDENVLGQDQFSDAESAMLLEIIRILRSQKEGEAVEGWATAAWATDPQHGPAFTIHDPWENQEEHGDPTCWAPATLIIHDSAPRDTAAQEKP